MNVALRPDSLNLISICTGGGGLDLGVELAIPSARSVCLVEREAFGVSQLVSAMQQGLLAQAPVWSDARTFDGRAWRGAVDGLIGGIPCQPHSLAGKRLEREDPRDLWSTARRILVQSGAWFVLIENVGGMLSSGGAERVYRDLGRLGFAREVGLFSASEVGASHERERTFILAVAGRDRVGQPGISELDGCSQSGREATARRGHFDRRDPALADTGHPRLQGRELSGSLGERYGPEASGSVAELRSAPMEHPARLGWREGWSEPGIRGGRDSVASEDGELGNSAGPGPHAASLAGADSGDESAGPRDAQPERRGHDVGHAVGGGRPGRADDSVEGSQRRVAAERTVRPVGLFPPGPSDLSGWADVLASSPELEPAFRRVADGLASRLDTARVDRLRMLGNGVVPLQAAYAIRTLAERLARKGHDRLWKLCQ